MFVLALRTLRFRAGSFVATFIALFVGATIVMACGGLLETGVRNNAPAQRLAGATVLVTGERTLDLPGEDTDAVVFAERVAPAASLVDRLRGLDGVAAVVGERTFDTALIGPGGTVEAEGHAWDSAILTPYTPIAGTAPTRADDVVLDDALARRAHVAVGDRVRIVARGETGSYRVAGVARAGHTVSRSTMFFAPAEAERLAGPRLADIAVVGAPGTDAGALRARVADALRGEPVDILTGDDRGTVEHPEILADKSDLVALAGVFGGLAVSVAMFVVAGTIGLSVRQRHREFALMRAIGGTPRQLRRMLLGETLLVTVFAAGAAWFTGPPAGRLLFDRLVEGGMVAETVEFSQGWIPAVAAAGALTLTALVGGMVGAHRAVTAKPTEALAESAVGQRWFSWFRLVAAIIALGGATALCMVTVQVLEGPIAASTAGPAVICAAIGLALVAPGLTKVLTWILAGPLGALTGGSGRVAMLGARLGTVRMAAVVTPIMLAVSITTGQLYLQTTATAEAERVYTESLRADAVLTSAAGGIDPALLADVRRVEGVGGASAYTTSAGVIERPAHEPSDTRGLELQGVDVDSGTQTMAVPAIAGSLADVRGETIALPRRLAKSLHRGVGDTIGMRLGDGTPVDLRVVALFEGHAGYESAIVPLALLTPHTDDARPAQILVRAAEGTSAARLVAALDAWTEARPGLRAQSRDAVLETHAEESRTQAWVNYLIIGMLAIYTSLSLINTLVLAAHSRRREFGLQRLNGATRAQVLHMSAVEATLTTVIGVLLGTAAAAAAAVSFSLSVTDSWLPTGSVWIYVGAVGTAAVSTFAATLIPTWHALRTNPVTAATA